jgi:DNA mismatch endonuclease, patch repair protein
MTDVVNKATRSKMMSGIKCMNTKPEIQVRKLLHRAGFRFRIHVRALPGTPDIVLSRFHAVIFVHGCFWHGHSCHLFKWPGTRKEFWEQKIHRTIEVNRETVKKLQSSGWRIVIIWECALKGKKKQTWEKLLSSIEEWLQSGNQYKEIKGIISEIERKNRNEKTF